MTIAGELFTPLCTECAYCAWLLAAPRFGAWGHASGQRQLVMKGIRAYIHLHGAHERVLMKRILLLTITVLTVAQVVTGHLSARKFARLHINRSVASNSSHK